MRLAEWWEQYEKQAMRHTRALPPAKRWERWYFRIFRVNPQSVVDRRMEALYLDQQEQREWLARNKPPGLS